MNATNGNLGVNTTNPQVKADINGPLGIKRYQLADLPSLASSDHAWAGTIVSVSKDEKTGLCGWDGRNWVPLSTDAKTFLLCAGEFNMKALPANARSNGRTSLPAVWNSDTGTWETPKWIYNQRLHDGEYRCNLGYHIGSSDPDGKIIAKDCEACSPIANQYGWTSDGKNNDCAFTCRSGYYYSDTPRSCQVCPIGTYTEVGNTDRACKSCTGLPANADWTSNGISRDSCTWQCKAGFNKRGNACKKASWEPVESAVSCNTTSGKWKNASKTVTYVCRDADGDLQDTSLCDHWGVKPSDRQVKVEDVNCNPPRLTEWSCGQPVCTGAGQCGGARQLVNCTRTYQDPAGNTYPTSHNLTKTESRSCDNVCEIASCGAAHNVNHMTL